MSTATPTSIALIPARAGSKRVPGKNIRPLAGHPILAYTVAAALESGIFSSIIVSTDAEDTAAIARHYGAEVPFLRPSEMSGDLSPDIEWVTHALDWLETAGRTADAFSLLRPTSPFRRGETIRRAWHQLRSGGSADSLRAVELCRQHPGKMWVIDGERMRPLLRGDDTGTPWHSRPYQALPPVHVQNASLEIAWTRTVRDTGTIAGHAVVPFFTRDYEGFDVNDEKDWWYAEHLLATGAATPPAIATARWTGSAAGAR